MGNLTTEGGVPLDPRLSVFLSVARAGQLTEAARQLNMSVSNVSQQISSLESDFGVRLFERSNRGARLSPAGEILMGYAESIEADWRRAFREVRQAASGDQTVHIAASHTVMEVFLPRPLGAFRRRFPGVQVKLTLDNSAGVFNCVETGQVDFGIVEDRMGKIGQRPLHVMDLWRDQLGLVVSARHPLSGKTEVSVADLRDVDLIIREEGSGTRRFLETALRSAGHELSSLRVTMELSSLRAIIAMVRHDVGGSVLSHMLVSDPDEPNDDISFVPIADLKLNRQIQLVGRSSDDQSAIARELVVMLLRDSAQRSRP